MGSLKRKMRRKKLKQAKKELQKKVAMFGELGDECLVCTKPFNKKSKQMVQEWFVAVRPEENKVNLYCPQCWSNALDIIDDFKKHMEMKNDN